MWLRPCSGVKRGDTVAIISIPEMFEAHYAVPMAGQFSTHQHQAGCSHNSVHSQHGEASVVIVDKEFGPVTEQALAQLSVKPQVIH